VVAAEGQEPQEYFAFPTLEQLARATDAALRQDGFGYRAKFVVGTVAALREKEEGGAAWLLALRTAPYAHAVKELITLPGIGPKVRRFSLDSQRIGCWANWLLGEADE
jgi:3-methyladenine DNA glycosylase/8-oxoguanine DNA glycosylase